MNHREQGVVTVFVAGITLALLLVAGLVVDGGYILAARREAANLAESAARAGAQQLDTATLRTGTGPTLDPAAATGAARSFLTATGHTGTVTLHGDVVHVEVTIHQPTYLLALAGTRSVQVTGIGESRPVRGIVSEGS